MVFGPGGEPGEPGINADDFGPFFHKIDDPVAKEIVRAGGVNIIPPDDHAFRNLIPWMVESFRKPLGCIKNGKIALDRDNGGQPGPVTGLAREAEHDVGAAVSIGQEADPGINIPARAHIEDHALGAMFIPDFLHFCFNEIQGFFPTDLFPFAFPPLAGPFDRIPEPVRVINVLGHGQGPGTEAPMIHGVVRVPFDFYQFSVLDMGKNAAAPMTSGTGRPGRCFENTGLRILHFIPSRFCLRMTSKGMTIIFYNVAMPSDGIKQISGDKPIVNK